MQSGSDHWLKRSRNADFLAVLTAEDELVLFTPQLLHLVRYHFSAEMGL